ncbi:MAG: TatD family hydrolase [Aestuariivirga sp.]|uniref:TatD family hydrolase n=1 Tax=Aestuariivirga sp. TaxID=2650926 RepID=UPI0025BE25E6|nr:TatD family hydrolase [Aestuariivirga sp.]MCA3560920.1 TatD family hydrolase [Aestuariivirga sp.]
MRVVDSHCHLDFEGMEENLPGVLQRAAEAGVERMVSISSRVARFDNLLRISNENTNVFCTVGTHPHNAHEELDVTSDELVRLAEANPKCVGIGEVGLDYHYDLSPRAAQTQGFRTHIDAARRTGLPLVIHSREAEDDTSLILQEEMDKGRFTPLLHCFTSHRRLADAAVAMGGYVSFSGILTYKSAEDLRQTAAALPLDRILVETDSPYLAPTPYRGQSNEPAFVVKTLETLAKIRRLPIEEMARITTGNFFRLFAKAS